MQYSKSKPTVGIRVSTDAYDKIKKVSYDQRITLNDALDYLLNSTDSVRIEELEKNGEQWVNFSKEIFNAFKDNEEFVKVWDAAVIRCFPKK